MKSQTLNLIIEKSSNKHLVLAIGLSIALVNTAITCPINAQSYSQDSYLPPEVIPSNQSMTYGTISTPENSISSNLANGNLTNSNMPGSISQITQQQTLQTPQEARKALYDAWTTSNIFPQSNNGQSSYNEVNNLNNLSNQNIPTGQIQNLDLNDHQNLNNQMNTTANNYQNTPTPPQSQTLSGAVSTQNTSQQRTTGGISHATGLFAGLAMGAFCLAGMRSGSGIYSAGLLGAGTANYGLNNGFRF